MNSLENSPFLNRLKGVFRREHQKEPTHEKLQTLHRVREILLTEDYPDKQFVPTMEWYEHMQTGLPREKLELIDQLYQKVAGSTEVNFRQDFPTVAKQFEDSFKPPPKYQQILDVELSALEKFDKYVNEYLESLQQQEVTGKSTPPLL